MVANNTTSHPVVLIAGASSGLGKAAALELNKHGYRIFAGGRREFDLGSGITSVTLDVCDEASVKTCVQRVVDETGRLDVLVNSAGISGPIGAVEELSIQDMMSTFEVNCLGTVRMMQAVSPIMRKQAGGRIVNVSSIGAQVALPFNSSYGMSKSAVDALSYAYRLEMRKFGVFVSIVAPGRFDTAIMESATEPENPLPEYRDARQKLMQTHAQNLSTSGDPNVFGKKILEIIQARKPKAYYLVGPDIFAVTLKRFLPDEIFVRLVEKQFCA